jgi:alpha-mannosidase
LIAWHWLIESTQIDPDSSPGIDVSSTWTAWKYLLQNHPHDSICGCSIDPVHEDMKQRFRIVDEIAGQLSHIHAESITRRIDTKRLTAKSAGSGIPLVVFNTERGPRTDYVRTKVEFATRPTAVHVVDSTDEQKPCQIVSVEEKIHYVTTIEKARLTSLLPLIKMGQLSERAIKTASIQILDTLVDIRVTTAHCGHPNLAESERLYARCQEIIDDEHIERIRIHDSSILVDVLFLAEDVPGFGYKTFLLVPSDEEFLQPTMYRQLENEFLVVEVEDAGTVSIFDKETGMHYPGCNRLEDGGDAGDEYTYSPPTYDHVISQPIEPPVVELIEHGPIRYTLKIHGAYPLPVGVDEPRSARSSKVIDVPVTRYVSLHRNLRRVEFRTVIDNRVNDHRLRALFPTGMAVDKVYAEGHFNVLERIVTNPAAHRTSLESHLQTKPCRRFVDITNGRYGLLLSTQGLPEYEALPGENGVTIALTLLRSVGWLSRIDLATRQTLSGPMLKTPKAQCIGQHVFEYAAIPHSNGWESAHNEAYAFTNPLWAHVTDVHEGTLPLTLSFHHVDIDHLVVSTVKMANDGTGIILRFYNPFDYPVRGKIQLFKANPDARVQKVTLKEDPIEELCFQDDGRFDVEVAKKQIVTIKYHPVDQDRV